MLSIRNTRAVRAIALALSIGCTGNLAAHAQSDPATKGAGTPKELTIAQKGSAVALSAREQKSSGVPDFGFMVTPAEYAAKYSDQPVFRLKTDFQESAPPGCPPSSSRLTSGETRSNTSWRCATTRLTEICPTGNPFKNRKARWYHIPWLHPTTTGPGAYPPNGGTEGFRGLIKEAPLSPLQLGSGQKGKTGSYSVYAITLVNDFAGYTLGQIWADPNKPDPRATDARYGGGFPPGTVFAKLLFTDAPQGQDTLPFLENPLQWKAYITENFWTSSTRTVTAVNLLQMDIAIRDSRADGPGRTGWVFGTFAYNGRVNNANKFLNLVPVGVMWGNDPGDTTNTTSPFPPTETRVNPNLKETVIFASAQLPPQHLGWNGRLNGPADLNTTSCLSCHITAQYPAVTSLVPAGAVPDGGPTPPAQGGSPEWMRWFQNIPAATSFDPRTYSTDYSFQVAISLQNFFDVNAARLQGAWASDYALPRVPIARGRSKN